MIGLGLSAGIGHYLQIMAFQRVNPAAALPFFLCASGPCCSAPPFFGELPDALSLASSSVAVGNGLFIALRLFR